MRHYVKQITLPHFQQKSTSIRGRRTDQGQSSTKHWSWKAFQCRQFFSRFLKETALVLVREMLLYYCTVCFERRRSTMNRQGTDQKQRRDSSEQMELGKCYPCLWTKFCMWTSLCLFSVCCVLRACTRSMAARKICLPSWWRRTPAFQRSLRTYVLWWTLASSIWSCAVSLLRSVGLCLHSAPCLLLLTAFMGGGNRGPDFPHLWRFVSGHLDAADSKGGEGSRDLHR